MRAGRLRHRVVHQTRTLEADAAGEMTETWVRGPEVWAAVEPISATERLSSDTIRADMSHKMTLRYLPGLSPKDRFLFGSRVLAVEAIRDVDERNVSMELLCREEA